MEGINMNLRRWDDTWWNQQHTASRTIERMAQWVRKISDSTPVEKGGKTWQNGKNLKRGHDTPVKWISTKRTWSLTKRDDGWIYQQYNAPGMNVRMKSKEWRRKPHLLPQMSLKSIFRRRVERSCWKTNNKKSKLDVGLWKTSQN